MDGYEHYDLQDEDPYLIEGSTCLKNLLGITNTAELNEAEAAISGAAMAELIERPVAPTFDLMHLCEIHFRLFGDVYDWAGHLRSTEISKGGMLFLPYGVIPQVAGESFSELHAEDLLRGLSKEEFAFRAATRQWDVCRNVRLPVANFAWVLICQRATVESVSNG